MDLRPFAGLKVIAEFLRHHFIILAWFKVRNPDSCYRKDEAGAPALFPDLSDVCCV